MRLRRKSHAGGVRSAEGATSPVGTGAYPRCVDAQATRAWWRRPVVRARVADVLYVLIGLIVTIGLAIAAVVLGDEYNVLEQLNLPALPVGDQTLATGGIIALAAIVLGTLLAAMLGGKVGERYHKRVDRAGFTD